MFKKLYGKWCYETHADECESVIVHVQELQYDFNTYQPTTKYYCLKMIDDKEYIEIHITSEYSS